MERNIKTRYCINYSWTSALHMADDLLEFVRNWFYFFDNYSAIQTSHACKCPYICICWIHSSQFIYTQNMLEKENVSLNSNQYLWMLSLPGYTEEIWTWTYYSGGVLGFWQIYKVGYSSGVRRNSFELYGEMLIYIS